VNSFAVVIPARLESTRLPGKVLQKIDGISMIEQVVRRVKLVVPNKDIYIATDNDKISNHAREFNIKTIITSKHHTNGTSRVAEAAKNLTYDYIIVVQADEILLVPEQLKTLIKKIELDTENITFNLVSPIKKEDLSDNSVVKTFLAPNSRMLFLCRGNPLTSQNQLNAKYLMKNTGIFAFPKKTLLQIQDIPDTPIQASESIEQLKLIENLIPIMGVQTNFSYPSINEEKDIEKYKQIMEEDELQQYIFKAIQ
jgi:3-deoxy-manno-octulosonate cytidylyltransferase (CMP-KDO synthetase)